ncbi:MAG: phospholipid carrier-dependent glycosyltransferase [Candidatus Woesearchaeota archaeon]
MKILKFARKHKVAAVIILAIVIRLTVALMYSTAGDSCSHFYTTLFFARHLRLPGYGEVTHDEVPFFAPPFFYVTAGLLSRLLGVGTVAAFIFIKLSPVFFGSLQIFFSYLIVKKLANEKYAFWSTVFLSFLPLHIFYSSVTFTDMPVAFLVTLSLFFLINKRYSWSAIACGAAVLTKSSALFFLPVVILYYYLEIIAGSESVRKYQMFILRNLKYWFVGALTGSIWLIRNYLVFRNPFYPFLGNIFRSTGEVVRTTSYNFSLHPLLVPKNYAEFVLDFFGLPSGRISLISSVFKGKLFVLFCLWLSVCIIISLPFLFGLWGSTKRWKRLDNKIKKTVALSLGLVAAFFVMQMIYFTYWHESFTRLILPSIIGYAFFWAYGTEFLLGKLSKNYKKLFYILLCGVIVMFVSGEIVKVTYATSLRSKYFPDYQWIAKNTPKNAKIYEEGDVCIQFYTGRISMINPKRIQDAQYIFQSKLTPLIPYEIKRLNLNETLKDYKLVYSNPNSQTSIYERKS